MKQLLAWAGNAGSTITSEAVMAMAEKFSPFFNVLRVTFVARPFHADISGFDPSVLPLAAEVHAGCPGRAES